MISIELCKKCKYRNDRITKDGQSCMHLFYVGKRKATLREMDGFTPSGEECDFFQAGKKIVDRRRG